MRCVERNKETLYYALYSSKTENVDGQGNLTGTYTVNYGSPVKISANVSAARGTADVEMFGFTENYNKTIVVDDPNFPIKEDSILWVGITPDTNGEAGAVKHNYVVAQVARSINSVTYAVRKVGVS